MQAETNYWLIWLIYLTAGSVFYVVFWWLTRFKRAMWITYSSRAVIAAIILTPWYANPQGEALAPALIVVILDAITIGSEAAIRATIPLILAITAAEIFATLLFIFKLRSIKYMKNK